MKEKLKMVAVPCIYALSIIMFAFSMYFVQKILSTSVFKDKNITIEDTEYVDKEIIENQEYLPVVSTKETIIKPYTSDNVKVGKNFYDYMGEADSQEQSIIYYENTYMQNSGIDYYSNDTFDVVSILDGTVIDIKKDNILGTIVEIRHTNELISVYQSLSEVSVNVDDTVVRGQIIGTSGKSNLNLNVENCLHFELYYMGQIVNPNDYYDKSLTDL